MTRAFHTQSLPATAASRDSFYPTPRSLAERLLSGIDWQTVDYVLEPSAGKGDLASVVCDLWNRATARYDGGKFITRIDCVEVDPNLRAILKERGFRVVSDDFLSFRTEKRYSLIVMNPPFNEGAKHLLRALDLQKNGGAVYCILNAETLRNLYTYERKTLSRQLSEYGAEIEYIQHAFADSERATDVEIALVRCVIPAKVGEEFSFLLDALRRDPLTTPEVEEKKEYADLAKADYIQAAVDRFQYECRAACLLIREWRNVSHLFRSSLDSADKYASSILSLRMGNDPRHAGDCASENSVIREIRKKYWRALFQNPMFTEKLTSNVREQLFSRVEELENYDFSFYNIYTLRIQLQSQVVKGIEDTIMKLFDDWTRKYHWDENSQNRHYFDGWRTNDAFAVNAKVIIPFYSAYDDFFKKFSLDSYRCIEKLEDIQKVFDFLSGCHSHPLSVSEILRKAEKDGETRDIVFPYFKATFYKKHTCHIRFTDMDVLKKFNLFAARGKKWLPPCYGRKRYADMDAEEKAVVDSFEGKASYSDTLARADYFLSTVSLPRLSENA